MAAFSVEVTGKDFAVEIEGERKPLHFLAIRVVEAFDSHQARSKALAEVLGLAEYSQIRSQHPALEITEIEKLSDEQVRGSSSTGLIFYDPSAPGDPKLGRRS